MKTKQLFKLKGEIVSRGIKFCMLAKSLGMYPSKFSLYLNGWREMPTSTKKDVAQYLKLILDSC